MRLLILVPVLLLPGCGLPPEAAALPPAGQNLETPRILPLNPLLAELEVEARAAPAADALRERTEALTARDIDAPSNDDLAERAARLRARAAALNAQEI